MAEDPQPLQIEAADGTRLGGFVWRHAQPGRGVVVVNPATSVRCRYYTRFAAFLFAHGFDVVLYDYRGIGESRPARLRGFKASWVDWGRADCEAALRYAASIAQGRPIDVVAHSVGGLALGLAPSNALVRRVFTMGAQYAYWPDYARATRLQMVLKWHVLMPALTALCGYFPAKRLGWMEDTPAGVVRDWSFSRARFEDTRRGRPAEQAAIARQFQAMTASILAVSVTDDPFGTVPAVERLLGCFSQCARTHLRLTPAMIGVPAIGHFAFFHSKFEHDLWQIPLAWLADGVVPAALRLAVLPRPLTPAALHPAASPAA